MSLVPRLFWGNDAHLAGRGGREVIMPTPGTKAKDARKAVDPFGYLTPKNKKKQENYKMGFSADVGNLVYNKPVKSPMIKRAK